MIRDTGVTPILETASDGVVAMDRTGRITDFSPVAEQMFGQTRSEVLGKLLAEVIVSPGARPKYHARLERYLGTAEGRVVGKRVELSALRRDGTTFPVELAIASADSNDGQSFTGLLRDISERKESEQALRASEERFRLLVQSVKDYAIFMLDSEGRVATWNAGAQACKGYTPNEILGQHFSLFYPTADRERGKPEEMLRVATEVGRVEDVGWRVRKDGSEFWADVLITGIRDTAGKLVGFAKVTRDLTERRNAADIAERKRLEERQARTKSQELEEDNHRMHEANRLKSEFLANMSHELRTPLNAIIGFTELMFKGKVGPVSADHKEYLGDILTSSRHLLKLINDVLDLAKVESGKMEFRPEPVDLGKVISEVCDILRGIAFQKRIHLETKVDPSAVEAVLDPSKLKQVLYNYLSNALKFTPEQGLVTIRVVPEGDDCVRIEVQDTGIGIRNEDIRRLFVEFQQLDAGLAKKYGGTGLGLALTKRIVEAQGGTVGLRSEPDKGSTFWAVLPRAVSGVLAPPTVESPLDMPASRPLVKVVLVVDDNPAALRLMDVTLRANGYSALCFSDPAEALRAMEITPPAVVVLDLLMPHMDGFALLDRLRAMPHMRGIPVIIWTVKDLSEVERKRLLSGAQRIVFKGQGESEAILDAIRPYLGADLAGDANAG